MADWCAEYNIPDTPNKFILFFSAIAVRQGIFWTKDNFYFFLITFFWFIQLQTGKAYKRANIYFL